MIVRLYCGLVKKVWQVWLPPAVEAVQEPVACAIEELGQRRNGAAHVGEEKLALAA